MGRGSFQPFTVVKREKVQAESSGPSANTRVSEAQPASTMNNCSNSGTSERYNFTSFSQKLMNEDMIRATQMRAAMKSMDKLRDILEKKRGVRERAAELAAAKAAEKDAAFAREIAGYEHSLKILENDFYERFQKNEASQTKKKKKKKRSRRH